MDLEDTDELTTFFLTQNVNLYSPRMYNFSYCLGSDSMFGTKLSTENTPGRLTWINGVEFSIH